METYGIENMAMTQKRVTVFRVIAITMLYLSAVPAFWLDMHYQHTCPTTPNEQSGAVYPLDDHGRVVYLTLAEHRKFEAALTYFIGMWLCGVALQ
jgi:hypothetical protein